MRVCGTEQTELRCDHNLLRRAMVKSKRAIQDHRRNLAYIMVNVAAGPCHVVVTHVVFQRDVTAILLCQPAVQNTCVPL